MVDGLTTNVNSGQAQVEVCGKECTLLEDISTETDVHCEVPMIQTIGSRDTFTLK
jgi:hypothetical protein